MIIIDTHVLLWTLYDSSFLSQEAKIAISDNPRCVSIASLWEMSIKQAIGKLKVPQSIIEIADICKKAKIDILPISPEHCQRIQSLPDFHSDPFDRIIIAQSLVEGWPLVTHDWKIRKGYPEVNIIW